MLHFNPLIFKKLFLGMAFVILAFFSNFVFAKPTILYDSNGQFVAYIDPDQQNTIFLASGKPIAYVDDNGAVYGFNGKFFGWFSQGIIWDESGRMLAFLEASEIPKTIKTIKINRVVTLPGGDTTTTTTTTQSSVPARPVPQVRVIEKPEFTHEFSDTPFSTIYVAQ